MRIVMLYININVHTLCIVRACRTLERVALDGSMEKLARFTLSECPRLDCTAFLANELSRLPPPRVCNRLLVLKPALGEILRVCVAALPTRTDTYSCTCTYSTSISIRDVSSNYRQIY